MLRLRHLARSAGGSHDFTDIDHYHTLAEAGSDHGPVEGPVDVENGLAVRVLLVLGLRHLAGRIVEGLDELLVFERPYVNILVLAPNCQERVVRTQREAAHEVIMLQRHQALCLVARYVVQPDALVLTQSHDEADAALVLS